MIVLIVEGTEDEGFLKACLKHWGYQEIDIQIVPIGGWNNLKNSEQIIRRYLDKDYKVAVVFDADDENNDGGFAVRIDAINGIIEDLSLELAVFLFPNNADDGQLEDLLESLVVKDRARFLDCFDNYEACIKRLETKDIKFSLPAKKARIYAYVDSLPESKITKDSERKNNLKFYNKPNYWDLDSSDLKPLKDFIDKQLE